MATAAPSIETVRARAVAVSDLVFAWRRGPAILDMARFEVGAGERVFLRGASGSGKSTLLGLLAGVLPARSGRLEVLGRDLCRLGGAARDRLRAERMGVVFQLFNLVPYLSVVENVTLPCAFSAPRRARAAAAGGAGGAAGEARRLLDRLGLGGRDVLGRSVRDLSVGQQQRVAVARALIGGPDLVLADEPTSALDADARDAFLALLLEEAAAHGSALVFVSHDAALGPAFDRVVDLAALNRAGRVEAGEAAR